MTKEGQSNEQQSFQAPNSGEVPASQAEQQKQWLKPPYLDPEFQKLPKTRQSELLVHFLLDRMTNPIGNVLRGLPPEGKRPEPPTKK